MLLTARARSSGAAGTCWPTTSLAPTAPSSARASGSDSRPLPPSAAGTIPAAFSGRKWVRTWRSAMWGFTGCVCSTPPGGGASASPHDAQSPGTRWQWNSVSERPVHERVIGDTAVLKMSMRLNLCSGFASTSLARCSTTEPPSECPVPYDVYFGKRLRTLLYSSAQAADRPGPKPKRMSPLLLQSRGVVRGFIILSVPRAAKKRRSSAWSAKQTRSRLACATCRRPRTSSLG
mmetsp:Transcript_65382/g.184122  ORF Transcript_65382/g.184122 Transcript_65382/m.184122 type:complete len:233 (-) Transcript_65382:501-1199(-)